MPFSSTGIYTIPGAEGVSYGSGDFIFAEEFNAIRGDLTKAFNRIFNKDVPKLQTYLDFTAAFAFHLVNMGVGTTKYDALSYSQVFGTIQSLNARTNSIVTVASAATITIPPNVVVQITGTATIQTIVFDSLFLKNYGPYFLICKDPGVTFGVATLKILYKGLNVVTTVEPNQVFIAWVAKGFPETTILSPFPTFRIATSGNLLTELSDSLMTENLDNLRW